jgi:hypothetical protein
MSSALGHKSINNSFLKNVSLNVEGGYKTPPAPCAKK